MLVLCFDHTDPWLSWLAWCSFVGVSVNIGFKCGKTESRVGAQRLEQALTQWRSQEFRLGGTKLKDNIGNKKLI